MGLVPREDKKHKFVVVDGRCTLCLSVSPAALRKFPLSLRLLVAFFAGVEYALREDSSVCVCQWDGGGGELIVVAALSLGRTLECCSSGRRTRSTRAAQLEFINSATAP